MIRWNHALMCLSLCGAPLLAQEAPEIDPVDDGGMVSVDPLPVDDVDAGLDPDVVVTFDGVDGTEGLGDPGLDIHGDPGHCLEGHEVHDHVCLDDHICNFDHLKHACDLDARGVCIEHPCLQVYPLPVPGHELPNGQEVMFYSLASATGGPAAMQDRGVPAPHFRDRTVETASLAAMANMPATLNAPGPLPPGRLDASRAMFQEQQLRTVPVAGRDGPIPTTSHPAANREPGLFGRMLVRNTQPAAITPGDQEYARKLANIDQLRDRALATGDEQLLAQADRLEQELKAAAPRGWRLFGRNR